MADNSNVEDTLWEPLSVVDYSLLAIAGILQATSFAACVHLIRWRKWPPYVTKSVSLIIIATVSGILWTVAMIISFGFIRREPSDILAACAFERLLMWSALYVHMSAFFTRIYRMWRLLIKHDDKMWRPEYQILILSSVSVIPAVVTWATPRSNVFDESLNACLSSDTMTLVALGMDVFGFVGILYLWFVCTRQLKWVRKQFNEYATMKCALLNITVTLASYVALMIFILQGHPVLQRRFAIFYPVMTTMIILWSPIQEPFLNKMWGNTEYLWSFTKGFAELPSPAQLRASLAEQLSVDQLREEFRRYIKTKVAQELVDFYLESLDREEMTGYFERQAVTMRIIDQYIREDAPDQVNISEECREIILETDVTAHDIFDEARAEVLAVMETNFQREFVTTEGFRRIQDASEEEQREIILLKAGGMLPIGNSPEPTSVAGIPPLDSSPKPTAVSNTSKPPPQSRTPSLPHTSGVVDALKKFAASKKKATSSSEPRR